MEVDYGYFLKPWSIVQSVIILTEFADGQGILQSKSKNSDWVEYKNEAGTSYTGLVNFLGEGKLGLLSFNGHYQYVS